MTKRQVPVSTIGDKALVVLKRDYQAFPVSHKESLLRMAGYRDAAHE